MTVMFVDILYHYKKLTHYSCKFTSIFSTVQWGIIRPQWIIWHLIFSSKFDTLDHVILLEKLRYHGINGTSLDWFWSYLSNRKQYVEIDNERFPCLYIKTGGPQRSILGPLLFLIYMNDIPNASQAFRFILYRDDTNLFSTIQYSTPICTSKADELLNCQLSLQGLKLTLIPRSDFLLLLMEQKWPSQELFLKPQNRYLVGLGSKTLLLDSIT